MVVSLNLILRNLLLTFLKGLSQHSTIGVISMRPSQNCLERERVGGVLLPYRFGIIARPSVEVA